MTESMSEATLERQITMPRKLHDALVKQIGPESDRTLRFVASDETQDRDGDILKVGGWVLENFQKNPVFLAFHDYYSIPVGTVVNVEKNLQTAQLLIDVKFAPIEELSSNPGTPSEAALLADSIYLAYKNKYLNTVSVGFIGIESKENEEDDPSTRGWPAWATGRIYTKQELLEVSAVPVPADPNAVVQSRGIKSVIKGQLGLLETIMNKEPKTEVKEQEMEMTKDEIQALIKSETEKATETIRAELKTAQAKAGARHSKETLEALTKAMEHADNCVKTLKGLVSDGVEKPADEESDGVEKPEDNGDDAGGKDIDLSTVDMKKVEQLLAAR